ncbi:hypothetical protein VTJ04DRAFT_2333 [Mycothermus thermophilus]|uniref:uncharacterized protein n=1 Tax=Humicola insolens TaxID=85995 RepID=UPI003742F298
MSSPRPPFRDSSPAASSQKRSRFTYRHLSQMASYSTSCPLRVIAHIDLDCFYAQAEMVRLGVPEDQPLAVQQWKGLIAINYPARKYGISRMCNIVEAKKMCPNLIAQHVATWREGDDKWAYRPDAAENISTDKVSLDPYRLESRKILALIKDQLPPHLQKVEKASIDEVFLDLSAHVHALLLERYPELAQPPSGSDGDLSTPLPMPPTTALDWQADALVDLDDEDAELDDPDWDDVAFQLASEIVRHVRAAIRERLRYTCAAGIARNKLLSKLGSAYRKPNQQTVIRNRAARRFLAGFKLSALRNLGGKLGEQVARAFGTDAVGELLDVPVEQFKLRLGDETGVWLYNTLRGVDASEVTSRTQIKSMLSAKAFRAPGLLTGEEQATRWLRIFVADIFARLVDEGVLEHKRRPKTLALHLRPDGAAVQARSRQCPIPPGKALDEETLLALARGLLHQIVRDAGPGQQVWPCAHLSMNVSGFEEGVVGNMGIDGFLLKGDEAIAAAAAAAVTRPSAPTHGPGPGEGEGRRGVGWKQHLHAPQPKRRRIGDSNNGGGGSGGGIERFFTKREPAPQSSSFFGSAAKPEQSGETLGINTQFTHGPADRQKIGGDDNTKLPLHRGRPKPGDELVDETNGGGDGTYLHDQLSSTTTTTTTIMMTTTMIANDNRVHGNGMIGSTTSRLTDRTTSAADADPDSYPNDDDDDFDIVADDDTNYVNTTTPHQSTSPSAPPPPPPQPDFKPPNAPAPETAPATTTPDPDPVWEDSDPISDADNHHQAQAQAPAPAPAPAQDTDTYPCPRCGMPLPRDDPVQQQSHSDWHFAKDLQDAEEEEQAQEGRGRGRGGMVFGGSSSSGRMPGVSAAAAASAPGTGRGTGRGGGTGGAVGRSGSSSSGAAQKKGRKGGSSSSSSGKMEKGQLKLSFG